MRNILRAPSLLVSAVLGCGGSTSAPEDFALPQGASAPVHTDADRYTLTRVSWGYAAEAVATYTNTTGRTVYYQRCIPEFPGPIHWLRRTGADSTAPAFVGSVWACVGGVPTGRIGPGETVTARVDLGSTDSPQARPPITPDQRIGRFRVEFALCVEHADDSDDCVRLPQPARESNAFELRFETP